MSICDVADLLLERTFIPLPKTPVVATTVTAASHTITLNQYYIRVDTTSNAITLALPDPATRHAFFLKDVGGVLETNNVTMDRFGSETFEDLAADKVLTTNYGGWFIWSDGTNWWMN